MTRHEGYTEIANDLFRESAIEELSKVDRLVYIAMLHLTVNSRGHVDESQSEIAFCAGITTKTLRGSLARLMTAGAIKYVASNPGSSDVYAVAQLERTEGVGFYKLPKGWLGETPLSTTEKLVYLVLMAWRDHKTKIATPAYTTIAREAGIARRAIHPAIERLTRYGLVEKLGARRAGPRQPLNRYRVHDPQIAEST